jgi:ribosomal protein L6P/L9E
VFKTIYPTSDSVIYSQFPAKAVGNDQILDLGKSAQGEPSIEGDITVSYAETYNSRILIKFDINELLPAQSNAEYFLT